MKKVILCILIVFSFNLLADENDMLKSKELEVKMRKKIALAKAKLEKKKFIRDIKRKLNDEDQK